MSDQKRNPGWLQALGPGILVAATGVGAGDLMTASLAGSALGVVILWAAVVGAVMKGVLTEGIARWQMATGTTLLEGWVCRLGAWVQWVFLAYLAVWCFFTGGALVSACGVAGTGLFPLGSDPQVSKIIWGVLHSALGLALVLAGGFKLFERLMAICVGVMFVAVIVTAVACKPDWAAAASGLVAPSIPAGGTGWILGLMGGVGGTLTLLSYGYWIREEGRDGESGLKACRLDLLAGYAMTAIFGLAMVLVGSTVEISGGGARMAPILADQLGTVLGPAGRLLFLVGFWGAVFSSLLGVWQSIPYLFADFVALRRGDDQGRRDATDFAKTPAYRACLVGLAVFSLPVLVLSVKQAQLAYAVLGSLFMPLLALTLLILNNRRDAVGDRFRNGWASNTVLVVTLLFFAVIAARTATEKVQALLAG